MDLSQHSVRKMYSIVFALIREIDYSSFNLIVIGKKNILLPQCGFIVSFKTLCFITIFAKDASSVAAGFSIIGNLLSIAFKAYPECC